MASASRAATVLRRLRPSLPRARIAAVAARSLHAVPHPALLYARSLPPFSLQRRYQSTHHPARLSEDEYHKLSDTAMDNMLESLEEAIDAGVGSSADEGWEVSYSSGVLTLSCGPHGTYVINKQPPNQQIWLSSPYSGPKRYDYSLPTVSASGTTTTTSAAADAASGAASVDGAGAEGAEGAKWVYHRDGSTLQGLLEEELAEFAGERVEVWVERRGEGGEGR
ncbi:Frataxin [Calocera cornea HHB12733]|uniref:ferroxidase n=1 Tax=Calocera cornea HHB12733 TaxID=1353952 RepID=A0A165GTH9_9BASI|nr:Frataxin [Calocera cornea HHB12733]